MWPFTRQSPRRKEIRRSKAERGQAWYRRLPSHMRVLPIATTVLAALLAAALVNAGGEVLDIHVGQTAPRAITSRVEFRLKNERRTIERRIRARENAPNYYRLDVSLLDGIRGRLVNALQLAKAHVADPNAFQEAAQRSQVLLDEEARTELLRIAALTDAGELQRAQDRYQAAVDDAIYRLAHDAPLLVAAIDPANRRTAVNAILIDPREQDPTSGTGQRPVPVSKLLPANQPEAPETVAEAAAAGFRPILQASMKRSIVAMLRGEQEGAWQPIYTFAAAQSKRAADEAYAAVADEYDTFTRNQRLADAGVITEEEIRLLRREQAEYRQWVAAGGRASAAELEQLRETDPPAYDTLVADRAAARNALTTQRMTWLGYGVLAMLIPLGLVYYLSQPNRKLRTDAIGHLVTALSLLAVLGVARMVYVGTSAAYYAIGVQALAAAILALVYTRGPVAAVAGSLALLVALATRQSVGFFLVLLVVSTTLLFGLRDVRNRGKIVLVGALASVMALATTVAAGLVGGQALAFVFWNQALPAAGTTLAAAFIIEGILPGIERVFRISTNMSLLEWSDASRPLLRMLAAEAPGTYNHSLLVGTLAEHAAEAIGARGLLARTGAYYHDIGKINKPGYFAENQAYGVSRHDRLSPAMSHLIIIGHVKDGIEMAREYGLPASLHQFIVEHHGTTLVEYFYHAASQQRKPGDREVSDVQFRYPGPKPQSRETAVVMLCDGVEGAVRAMPEPTPGRIEDTVAKIVQRRLVDGQFDECDLTFRELETIERTLVKSLCAIYHSRVAYPEREDEKKSAEPRAS